MLRTAVTPRWLALLAVVVVVCVAFGWMGAWQLGVARDKGADEARRAVAAAPRLPVEQVLEPQQGFPVDGVGRKVAVAGQYDAGRQVLVAGRMLRGEVGWWVVTAVRSSAGAWLPVVRGWVRSPDDPAAAASAVPAGRVEVEGVLQPDEAPATGRAAAAAGGTSSGRGAAPRLAALDAAELVNLWGSPIYNGYVVLTAEEVAEVPAPQPDRVPAPVSRPSGLVWRNAAYAAQWWVFAGFAVVLWWKMVTQDARERGRPDDEGVAA